MDKAFPDADAALAGLLQDGITIMAGGFGLCGIPEHLIAAIRRAGVSTSHGEIDAGRIGIAAPVFDRERAVLGSLSIALPEARDASVERLAPIIADGARAIERAMNDGSDSHLAGPARVKIARPR